MQIEEFTELVEPIAAAIAGKPVDGALEDALNREFPAQGEAYGAIAEACREAIAEGWMCSQGGAGRRFGRVIEAGPETHGLSVDVVDLDDIVGPHHRHPKGEICMIMPITPGAKFDGQGEGWKVYEPGTAHHPTVSDGEAVVLYMLPGGEIEFTGQ